MCAPSFAVTYPSLAERRPDDDTVTMFFGDPSGVNHEFIESQIGCINFLTQSEAKAIFERAVLQSLEKPEDLEDTLGRISCRLEHLDEERLTATQIKSVCQLAGVREAVAEKIAKRYEQDLAWENLTAADLYVKKWASKYRAMQYTQEIKKTLTQAAEVIENMSGSEDLTQDMRKLAAGL